MSLLDNPPHVVEVQLRENQKTGRGASEPVAVGDPIKVPCSVQPVREWSTAEEYENFGLQLLDLRQLRARNWPGDYLSLVYHAGDEYETVGDPQVLNKSPRTRHTQVVLRRRRRDPRHLNESP